MSVLTVGLHLTFSAKNENNAKKKLIRGFSYYFNICVMVSIVLCLFCMYPVHAEQWISDHFGPSASNLPSSWKTRSAWQSQTWGRPAPQYRVDCQFSYSKFLSQQRHLPNEPENCNLEPRGISNCVRLQCTSNSGVSISFCAHTFFVCGPKFTTSPRKLWWGYSH